MSKIGKAKKRNEADGTVKKTENYTGQIERRICYDEERGTYIKYIMVPANNR